MALLVAQKLGLDSDILIGMVDCWGLLAAPRLAYEWNSFDMVPARSQYECCHRSVPPPSLQRSFQALEGGRADPTVSQIQPYLRSG